MSRFFVLLFSFSFVFEIALAFPNYGSLAKLSARELDVIIPQLEIRTSPSPPGPLKDTSAKLVNDPQHPWRPAGKNDIRGVCPGLNTLASHGASSFDGLNN